MFIYPLRFCSKALSSKSLDHTANQNRPSPGYILLGIYVYKGQGPFYPKFDIHFYPIMTLLGKRKSREMFGYKSDDDPTANQQKMTPIPTFAHELVPAEEGARIGANSNVMGLRISVESPRI